MPTKAHTLSPQTYHILVGGTLTLHLRGVGTEQARKLPLPLTTQPRWQPCSAVSDEKERNRQVICPVVGLRNQTFACA